MKTSKVNEKNVEKRRVIIAAIILSVLGISLNSLPMDAEGAVAKEKVQSSEMVVEPNEEVHTEVESELKDTKLAFGYVRVAQAYADEFQYEDGLLWAEIALQLDPVLPEAHLIYGYLHFKLVHSEEAIAAFERTLELEPTTFDAYLYLGIIHRGAGDPDLGIEYFTQAIQVAVTNENLSTAYAERGLAYGNLDRYEESFTDFETALSINPDNGWAIFFQGIVSEKKAEQESRASGQSGNTEPGAGISLGF
jgi:tetratricopeptide (TPR) repeat protein